MLRTLLLSVVLLLATNACTESEQDDDLVLEDDGGKADVARPYGTFHRALGADEGFTELTINEDRTFSALSVLAGCDPTICVDREPLAGTYRFARSHGNPYIVFYLDGLTASFQYELDGDSLKLRETGTDEWIEMVRVAVLELDESDDGGTFDVVEGDDVVVRLTSNPATGYDWQVVTTDRTFGYPTTAFEPASLATGSGGKRVLTWKTKGYLSLVGTHSVTLAYRRSWETNVPPASTFTFTVDVQQAN
jgi:inhibitor of cysteine peptidase